MLVFLLVVVFTIAVIYVLRSKKHANLPPVIQYGMIPYLSTLLAFSREPNKLLLWAKKKYGNAFTISIFGMYNMTYVFADDALDLFFKAKDDKLSMADAAVELISFLLETSKESAVSPEAAQKKLGVLRELLTTESRLRDITLQIQDEVATTLSKWETMERVPILEEVTKLVVAINTRVFVGDEGKSFANRVTQLYQIVEEKGTSVSAMFVPFSSNRKDAIAAKAELTDIMSQVMEKRKAFIKEHPDEKPKDMLQYKLDTGDSAFSITGDLIATFFAAHVNTVSTNVWSLLHLAQEPEWQDKMSQELKSLGSLDAETLKHCNTMSLIIKETIRLHALIQLMRTAKQDVTLKDCFIPKGHMILISPYVMHQDETVFENANQWQPERFQSKQYGCRYVQWGYGFHRCVGEHFAYMVTRTLLAHVVAKYRIELLQDKLPEPLFEKMLGMPPPRTESYIKLHKK